MAGSAKLKPRGSAIVHQVDAGRLKLTLREPVTGAGRVALCIFLAVWLCVWAVAWVYVAEELARGGGPPGATAWNTVWLVAWTAGGVVGVRFVWLLARPPRAETLALGPDDLQYDPGTWRVPDWLPRSLGWAQPGDPFGLSFYHELFRRRRPANVARPEASGVRLVADGPGRGVYLDLGANRIVIGAGMGPADLEWLHGILADWHGAKDNGFNPLHWADGSVGGPAGP